ncbi:hypothetical protein ACQ4PT_023907 [Festuca glaucescens]
MKEDAAARSASVDKVSMGEAAASISDATASSSGGKDADLDDMFSHLELNEDELDDVVIGVDEAREYQQAARWLAIGKVHTTRSFSAEALFEKMKVVWNLSRDPICREAGENLFIFQMHCLGDWKKVVHQGPWTFRGWGVLIEDYDGLSDPEQFVFGGLYAWAQVHGIPELYRKQEVVDDLARRVGKVKEVQMSPKLFYEGNYVRFRVRLDITRPLLCFVSLTRAGHNARNSLVSPALSLTLPEGKRRLVVKYEKISFFCKRCGFLGHDHEECGDGVWTEKQLQYGTWMLAVRIANQPTSVPRRFTPRAPLRGGFTGRAMAHNGGPKKRSSGDADLDDEGALDDTSSSPEKKGDPIIPEEEENNKNPDARRQLDMNLAAEGKENTMDTEVGLGENLTPPLPPLYVKTKDRTKVRKTGSLENVNENLATSAASLEDVRRAQ